MADTRAITPEIERVARAIYEKRNGDGCHPWAIRGGRHREPYIQDAIAAIEALMVPSERMLRAALRIGDEEGLGEITDMDAECVWQAMLLAALGREHKT